MCLHVCPRDNSTAKSSVSHHAEFAQRLIDPGYAFGASWKVKGRGYGSYSIKISLQLTLSLSAEGTTTHRFPWHFEFL